MVSIRLEVERIDYEKSIEGLLPQIVEHYAAKSRPSELEKCIGRLGADAAPIALKLLGYLEDDAKDELVVWLISSHEERLRKEANEYLKKVFNGNVAQIGYFSAQDQPGSRLELLASDIKIDYDALFESPAVMEGVEQLGKESGILKGAAKLALQMGSRMSAESLEKQGVALLGSGRVKGKLLPAFAEALQQVGLWVAFRDMEVESGNVIALPEKLPGGAEDEGLLPDSIEDALIEALVRWMREST